MFQFFVDRSGSKAFPAHGEGGIRRSPARRMTDEVPATRMPAHMCQIHPEDLPSGFLKAFPAHGEGGPLAVDEVPGSPILDSIVPGQVGQGTVHAAKPRSKCMSEVVTLLCNYCVALTRINRPLVPFTF